MVRDAERFADGLISEGERRQWQDAFRAMFPPRMTPDHPVPPSYLARMVAFYTIWSNSVWNPGPALHLNGHGAEAVSTWVARAQVLRETGDWDVWPPLGHPTALAEAHVHCGLLRDVFGNPFRPVTLDANGLTPAVRTLARAAYEDRALPSGELDRQCLAVLADALEEAGCTDVQLLGHLRGPGPHVRGCWPLDLLLAKG
jgi:hypothetical protein